MNHQEFRQASRALRSARDRLCLQQTATPGVAREAIEGGDPVQAEWAVKAVLREQPAAAEWWLELARLQQQNGLSNQARASLTQAVEHAGNDLVLLHRIGRYARAAGFDPRSLVDMPATGEAAASPDCPETLHDGVLSVQQAGFAALCGELHPAIEHLENEVRKVGPAGAASKQLADLLEVSGEVSRAGCVRGRRLAELGRGIDALNAFSASSADHRTHPEFACAYIRALRLAGNDRELLGLAGADLPLRLAARLELAEALLDLGRDDWVDSQVRQALKPDRDPTQLLAWWLVQPSVAFATPTLERGLRRAEILLDLLDELAIPIEPERRRAFLETIAPAFYLAYQGKEAESLQRRYCGMVQRWMAALAADWELPEPVAALGAGVGRLRIGYATSYAGFHTVMRHFAGWLEHADRSRFEIHLFPLASERDWMTDFLVRQVDRAHAPMLDTEQAARQIIDAGLDILVYPEVGMDPLSFRLAALRLAPMQCAAWGHPVSTGFASIDHYLSADAMEPANAVTQYLERLVRLPGIGVCVPQCRILGRRKSRAEFGFAPDDVICLSPQSLFKYHPEDDAILARIASAIEHGVLVFVEADYPAWTRCFESRLRAAFANAGARFDGRVRFVGRQAFDDFLSLLHSADLFIDCLGWSGGMTTLDALAVGLPVVTLPGETMRSRQSAGMLAQLGLSECVARSREDLVERVVRLGSDAALRQDISGRILGASGRLFGDRAGLRALEDFFESNHRGPSANHSAELTTGP